MNFWVRKKEQILRFYQQNKELKPSFNINKHNLLFKPITSKSLV